MKKLSKILFSVLLSVVLIFALSVRVNAADEIDYSDYPELEDSSNETTETNETSEGTQEQLPVTTPESVTSNNENNNTTTENTNTTTEETKTEETKTEETKTKPETKTENKVDVANKAPESHVQAGSFQNTTIFAIAGLTVLAILVAYIKLKKYNY